MPGRPRVEPAPAPGTPVGASTRRLAIVAAASVGGAILGFVVEPSKPQYWLYLAAAAGICAQWPRGPRRLAVGLGIVAALGLAGGVVASVFASAIPFAVAALTTPRTSSARQLVHGAVVAAASFAALLVPEALGGTPLFNVAVWALATIALVVASHRVEQKRMLARG